jgi:putative resolvase
MIKIGEFAKLIGRSIQTLRNWEKCGVLIPFKTINRVRYYSEAQLKQFVDKSGDIMV